jgi:hypothetical protein
MDSLWRVGRRYLDPPRPRPDGEAGADHRVGVATPLIVVLFALFAIYAAVLALVSHGAESVWGMWAACGYGVGALVALWYWRRAPSVPLLVALAGGFGIPAALLPTNWGATSEVRVVARAASLWLAHGTPYLASNELVSWRSYDPYLPGMSMFGLPHAAGLPGALGDPLVWLAIGTVVPVVAAFRIAAPGGARRCSGCRRQAMLRALLLLSCPLFALPMSLGVTDPPVIALVCLGLAWTARSSESRSDEPTVSGSGPTERGHNGRGGARGWTGHPGLAGIAIGSACALKATAWPALPVILALVAARDGGREAVRFAGASLGTFIVLVGVTAPKLLVQPSAFWQNIVAYPLGLSRRMTQAASPLPGHLLASVGSLGHLAAIFLLVGAAAAIGASLVVRPPGDVWQATARLVVGLATMFLLAPDARFGYIAYPLGILFWSFLTFVGPFRTSTPGNVRGTAELSGGSVGEDAWALRHVPMANRLVRLLEVSPVAGLARWAARRTPADSHGPLTGRVKSALPAGRFSPVRTE